MCVCVSWEGGGEYVCVCACICKYYLKLSHTLHEVKRRFLEERFLTKPT